MGQQHAGEMVCAGFNVGLNSIVDATRSDGLASTDAVPAALPAGTDCGSCLPELNRILDKERPGERV